jgi:serine palmitoyltransferase
MLLPNVYNLGYSAGQLLRNILEKHQLPELPSPSQTWNTIISFPFVYKDWWLKLVSDEPVHVFVETTLLLSVLYMILMSKQKDWRENQAEKLTEAEKDDLVREWRDQGRAPLAPEIIGDDATRNVVVHAMKGRTMEIQYGKSTGKTTTMTVLNFATHDFLGMADNPSVKAASREALSKYGCGSCGPRGFYGTIDVHLKLEDAMSAFTDTEGAIMYSDGASTVSSTIAAFAKRGDLLVVDDGVYEPIVTGVTLSRANIKWFRHNDMVRLDIQLA